MPGADLGELGTGGDLPTLQATTRAAFFAVTRARSHLNADLCRRVMTQAAWEEQSAAIAALVADGRRQVHENLMLSGLNPTNVTVEGATQRVTLRGMVSGKSYVVDGAGRVVDGDRSQGIWVEEWTLQRSVAPADVAERAAAACAGCGAPLNVDRDGLCVYCRAPLPGFAADWLVASIRRPPVAEDDAPSATTVTLQALAPLRDDGPAAPPAVVQPDATEGVAAISARDPGFAPADFVVGVRRAFLAVQASRADLDPLVSRPYLGDELWTVEQARIEHDRQAGRHTVRAYLDIDAVSIAGVEVRQGRDRVTARVAARSADHVIDIASERVLEGGQDVRRWTEDIVLERAQSARTQALRGFADGVCPACAATQSVDAGGHCASCGRYVTDGSIDWVIVGMGETVPAPAGPLPVDS